MSGWDAVLLSALATGTNHRHGRPPYAALLRPILPQLITIYNKSKIAYNDKSKIRNACYRCSIAGCLVFEIDNLESARECKAKATVNGRQFWLR